MKKVILQAYLKMFASIQSLLDDESWCLELPLVGLRMLYQYPY